MNNFLNDKLCECYFITTEVVVKYYDLCGVMSNHAIEDASVYQVFASEVKELVLKEYEVYRRLTLDDINFGLEQLKNIDCISSIIYSRFQRKLEVLRDVYSGAKVTGNELKLDFIPKDMEFTIFASIASLVDIEMMKKVKNILDKLDVKNYNDLQFTKSLYSEFNLTLFYQTFGNNLTEMINLSFDMNIENVPKIDSNILINIVNNMFGIENDNGFNPIEATMLELAKITIDRLTAEDFVNSPKNVFSNLAFITRLEILISYMNKNSLNNLLSYCIDKKDKNRFGINNAIDLIKTRIK